MYLSLRGAGPKRAFPSLVGCRQVVGVCGLVKEVAVRKEQLVVSDRQMCYRILVGFRLKRWDGGLRATVQR